MYSNDPIQFQDNEAAGERAEETAAWNREASRIHQPEIDKANCTCLPGAADGECVVHGKLFAAIERGEKF